MNYFKKVSAFFITLIAIVLFTLLSTSLTPVASADSGQNSSQNTVAAASSSCNPILTFRTPPWSNNPNKVVYHFKLKNCATTTPARNYKLIPNLPGGANAGWRIDFGSNVNAQNIIRVTKGNTISFDATITPPANATVGSHDVSLTARWIEGTILKDARDTLNFKYIVENECVNKNPVLSAVPDTKTGKPGNKVPFLVTLDNKNEGCSAPYPDYKLSVVGGVPSGWKVDFTKPNDSNVVDDTLKDVNDKRDFKVKITSPNNATDKKFTIKAVNVNKNNFTDTIDLTYNIESDTTCTVSGDKNPHFTCSSNNTCVAVNACGQNAGGCTAAGGTCGDNITITPTYTVTPTPPTTCVRKEPELKITADKTWAKPGGKITYTLNIKNIDQGPCPMRKMSFTKTLYNTNWTSVWDPNNSFEFNKGEVRTKKLIVTSPEQAPVKTYLVKIHLKNNADVIVFTKQVNFVVANTPPTITITPTPTTPPTFTPVLSITSYGGRTCVDNSIVTPAKIGWTHPSSTTTFTVKKGDTSGGPYSVVATTSDFEYTVPAEEDGYYVVSTNGGPNSNEVVSNIPDVTPCPTITPTETITPTPTAPPDSCNEGENNPYFVCQSNACVAVTDACGVNSEGCSSAGGSCGTTPGTTSLSFVIGLDSIGTTGTSRVSLFSASNKDPQHPQRNFKVEVFDQNNGLVYQTSNVVNYVAGADAANYGKFTGTVDLEDSFPTGFYTVKVSVEGYLAKQFPGTLSITKGQNNNIQLVNLVTGDIDVDNTLSILDYNLLISCSIFAKTDAQKTTCDSNPSFKTLADINDDGIIDQIDYSYFLQDYSIQNGD